MIPLLLTREDIEKDTVQLMYLHDKVLVDKGRKLKAGERYFSINYLDLSSVDNYRWRKIDFLSMFAQRALASQFRISADLVSSLDENQREN